MARTFSSEDRKAGLTLIVKPINDPDQPVDAEQFLQAATKWLTSLASFATDSGLSVRWEIAELRRSSAVLEVVPIDVTTGIIANSVARDWGTVIEEIESTGTCRRSLHVQTLKDIERFTSTANDLAIVITSGDQHVFKAVTANTQKRVKEAVAALPTDQYAQEGTVRGSLAVLNSWNPEDRWFRLKIPLAPEKQIRCVYEDSSLIDALSQTFEKGLDVTGLLHFRRGEVWPHRIDVRSVQEQKVSTVDKFLAKMKPFRLPPGMDSVSAIRSLRDAE